MPRELFHFDTAASVADFSPIDDRVMGGRSASRLRHDPAGHAVFEGEVLAGRRWRFRVRSFTPASVR